MPEHMQTLRQMKALDKLISLLSEDNEYIVTQVCGILNNLSSSSLENVDSLRSLNNPHFLTLLRKDRNRGVVRGAKLVLERMILSKNGLSQESINGTVDLDQVLESLYYLNEDNNPNQDEGRTPTRKMNHTDEVLTGKNENTREDGATGEQETH